MRVILKSAIIIFLVLNCSTVFAQWAQLNAGTGSNSFNCVYLKGVTEAFVAGGQRIYRTVSLGTTWDTVSYGKIYSSLINSEITNIHFVSAQEGIACANVNNGNMIIVKSFDGGLKWDSIVYTNFNSNKCRDLFFTSSSIGYGIGTGGLFLRTNNGGNTWSTFFISNKDLYGVHFIGSNGWIAGDKTILKTTDGGNSFTSQSFPTENFKAIHFLNDSIGFAAGSFIYKTLDGGVSWNKILMNDTINGVKFYSTTSDTIFLATTNNLLKSNDAGVTWHPQYTLPYGRKYTGMAFGTSFFGMVTNSFGEVYRTFNNGDPVQTNDAGIQSIFAIDGGTCSGSVNSCKIKLKNYGLSNIVQAKINTEINGVPQLQYIYNGNIPFDSAEVVTLGNFVYPNAINDISVSISEVNNQNSININNDTLSNRVILGLSGTYTVGGNNPDFVNLKSALLQLKKSGTCGNVVFSIRDGNQLLLDSVIEYSTGNLNDSIFITSQSSDSSKVNIKGALIFKNCKNIHISEVSINSIQFIDSTNNVSVSNCLMDGDLSYGNVLHYGKALTNIRIQNTKMYNSQAGVYLYNDSLQIGNNVEVVNCQIESISSYGIFVNNSNNVVIEKNSITQGDYGVAVNNCNDGLMIKGNRLVEARNYEIGLFNCRQDSLNEGLVVNNFSNGKAVSSTYGDLSIIGCSYIRFCYNTIVGRLGNSLYLNFPDTSFPPQLTMLNNVFGSNSVSIFLKIYCPLNTSIINKNFFKLIGHNFYCVSNDVLERPPLFKIGINFEAWKSIFPSDSTSNYLQRVPDIINNQFVLSQSNIVISNQGKPITDIYEDIESNPRSLISPDPGCNEFNLIAIDGGVTKHFNDDFICPGSKTINISIKNFGLQNISSVRIHWKVNNMLQPVFNYSGFLLPGAESASISIGAFNFLSGTYEFKIWTENPNNIIDNNNWNDTLIFTINTLSNGLAGVYTIGGVSPDFLTLNDAVDALDSNGICSSVLFNIRSGYYNERITIPYINGVSYSDTIVFKSEVDDSSAVVIWSKSTNGSVIFLEGGASYISFNKLSVIDSSDFDACITVDGYRNGRINITNCVLNSVDATYCIKNVNSNLMNISNNLMTGSNGLYFNSNPGSYTYQTTIRNNIINVSNVGINVNNAYFTTIDGNDVRSTGYTGVPFQVGAWGHSRVVNNKLIVSNCNIAMKLRGCQNHIDSAVVANNMIIVDSIPNGIGVEILPSEHLLFANNSIMMKSSVLAGYGLRELYSVFYQVYRNRVINNSIFTSSSSVKPLSNFMVSATTYSNNNYYSPGDSLIIENDSLGLISLDTWKAVSGRDSGSISHDPLYVSSTDLHTRSPYLNNAAKVLPEITTDFDFELRNTITPDIGCDEVNFNDSLVWPGDANYDGVADNYDLLPLGMYFGQSGIPRINASNFWNGQPSANWGSFQSSGWDKKHVDCNGDGIIGWSDTLAINQNWGLQHSLRRKNDNFNIAGLPALYFITNNNTYLAGDTVTVELWSGDSIVPVNSIYGLAFDVNIPINLIQPGSLQIFFNTCWIGQQNINLATTSRLNDHIAAAVVLTDGLNNTGYGKIADIRFIISPSVLSNPVFYLSFIRFSAIEANGTPVNFNMINDSLQIISVLNNNEDENSFLLNVYPVPANEELLVEYTLIKPADSEIRIYNVSGDLLVSYFRSSQVGKIVERLPINRIPSGLYIIKIISKSGVSVRRFIKG